MSLGKSGKDCALNVKYDKVWTKKSILIVIMWRGTEVIGETQQVRQHVEENGQSKFQVDAPKYSMGKILI